MALFLEPTGCKYVGKKCKLIVNMTIVESRHHVVTPCRVSDGEGGEWGSGEGVSGKGFHIRLQKWNIERTTKDIESGKCLRRKRNESVLNLFPFRVNQLGLIFRRPSYSLSSPVISFPFVF